MSQAPEILKQLQSVLSSVSPEQAEQEISRIDGEIEALQEERSTWGTLHFLTRQLGDAANGETSVAGNGVSSREIPPLRQAILSIMNEKPQGSTVRLSDLSADLREREWLADSKNDNHRLQMMASTLVKENKLFRPTKGYYQLASGNGAAQDALPEAPENEDSEPLLMATRSQEGQT